MTAFLTIVSVLVPLAMAFLFLCLVWPGSTPVFADLPFKCCLSVGFGFGISSCLVFVWLLLVGNLRPGLFVCQLALLGGLLAAVLHRAKLAVAAPIVQPRNFSSGRNAPWLMRVAFAVALLCAAARFSILSWQQPNGQFDAFAHWNLEARFLSAGDGHLRQYSYMTWSHPDYPLLIPGSIAGAWALIGTRTTVVPCVIAWLFTFSLVGLVSISIARLRDERQGLLAGLCLLGTPFLIEHGASQYADVPVAFFYVATIALLFRNAEASSSRGFLMLSGAAAGLAAWTKNEGLLFAVSFVALYLLITAIRNWKTIGVREMPAVLMGLAPILAIVIVHKAYMGQMNDLVVGQNIDATTHRVLDVSRYAHVIKQMALGIFSFGKWNHLLPLPLLLFIYSILAGMDIPDENKRRPLILAALLTFVMGMAFFSIYIVTPWDLSWHLETSLNRLLLQLLPLAILVYFGIIRAREKQS
jgi:4-amino-4-deoxy-L-arabinose transferase-like glycosyltransferase